MDNFKCSTCSVTKEIDIIYEVSKLITNSIDVKNSLEKAIRLIKSSLYLENCVIYELDEDNKLTVLVSTNFNKFQKKSSYYKLGEGATGLAAKTKEPVVVENVQNNILFLNKSGIKSPNSISYVAVPMVVDTEVTGVLAVNLTKMSPMDFDKTIEMLSIISPLFAQTIHSHNVTKKQEERLKDLKQYYKMEWDSKVHNFGDIVGESPKMQDVFKVIDRIAATDVTVLVRGETGTGKELVAAAIHKRSKDPSGPFVKLNCAAISDSLIESELFGHEKGAFTDAKDARKGRFELSDGGTLFLDEIGDISQSAQAKILRVLQEREFERVGGSKTIKVHVRLVAATNRDLEQMVKDKKFREDLYYRLNVIPIDLPPLRERGDDIKLLVNFFLEKAIKNHKKPVIITDEAMEILVKYPWPGNVRELENTIERIVLMGNAEGITKQDMLLLLPALRNDTLIEEYKTLPMENKTLDELEAEAIQKSIKTHDGNLTKAAKALGITLRQIRYKVDKYGISTI